MIAFDARGNLWVANARDNELLVYDPGEQAKPSGATPSWTIFDHGGLGIGPTALAFDNRGWLWAAGERIVVYSPEQLLVTGAPDPPFIFTELATHSFALDPAPAELPI